MIPHSFQPSFFSKSSRFPWVSGGCLERRTPGKNEEGIPRKQPNPKTVVLVQLHLLVRDHKGALARPRLQWASSVPKRDTEKTSLQKGGLANFEEIPGENKGKPQQLKVPAVFCYELKGQLPTGKVLQLGLSQNGEAQHVLLLNFHLKLPQTNALGKRTHPEWLPLDHAARSHLQAVAAAL